VADLGFSPNDKERRHEAQKREWARNRIIGHGFRVAARLGWLIPLFPFFSVVSVVKDTANDESSTKNQIMLFFFRFVRTVRTTTYIQKVFQSR